MKFLASVKLSEHMYKDNSGYLICQDAVLARTGKQQYRKSELFDTDDDTIIDVDRPEEEVFNEKTLASFENKPICDEHPSVDVNPSNYNEYSVGNIRDIHRGEDNDQPVMIGTLVITDEDAIEAVENGKRQLSCGYDCDLVEDGNGGFKQVNIRGNHVALCEEGRAGIARIKDSKVKDDGNNVKVCLAKERYAVVSTKEWRIWNDDAYADFVTSDYKKAKDYQDRCKYDTIIIDCYNNNSILDSKANDGIDQEVKRFIEHKVREGKTADEIFKLLAKMYKTVSAKIVQSEYEKVTGNRFSTKEIMKYGFKDSINDAARKLFVDLSGNDIDKINDLLMDDKKTIMLQSGSNYVYLDRKNKTDMTFYYELAVDEWGSTVENRVIRALRANKLKYTLSKSNNFYDSKMKAKDTAMTITTQCYIFDGDKVLIQDRVGPAWKGLAVPGGHVKVDEDVIQSCIREVKEETGLDVSDLELFGTHQYVCEEDGQCIAMLYKTNSFEGFIHDSEEGIVQWMTIDEVLASNRCAEGFKELLSTCCGGLQISDSVNDVVYEQMSSYEQMKLREKFKYTNRQAGWAKCYFNRSNEEKVKNYLFNNAQLSSKYKIKDVTYTAMFCARTAKELDDLASKVGVRYEEVFKGINDSVNDSLNRHERELCDYILENCYNGHEDAYSLLEKMRGYYSEYSDLAYSKSKEVLKYFESELEMMLDCKPRDGYFSELQSGEYKSGTFRVMKRSAFENAMKHNILSTTEGMIYTSLDEAKRVAKKLGIDYVVVNLPISKIVGDEKMKDARKAEVTVWLKSSQSKKDFEIICNALNTKFRVLKETPTEMKVELNGDVSGVVEDLQSMKMMSTSLSSVRYTDSVNDAVDVYSIRAKDLELNMVWVEKVKATNLTEAILKFGENYIGTDNCLIISIHNDTKSLTYMHVTKKLSELLTEAKAGKFKTYDSVSKTKTAKIAKIAKIVSVLSKKGER